MTMTTTTMVQFSYQGEVLERSLRVRKDTAPSHAGFSREVAKQGHVTAGGALESSLGAQCLRLLGQPKPPERPDQPLAELLQVWIAKGRASTQAGRIGRQNRGGTPKQCKCTEPNVCEMRVV